MNAIDTIKKTHISIMTHTKWCRFAGVLACGKVEITTDIPTACTDGWDVKYNPDFVLTTLTNAPQRRLVVLHEATHKAYQHTYMWQHLFKENARLANIAADHFVNLALTDEDNGEGFLEMPTMGIQPDAKYRGWSVKQIFDDLKANPPTPRNGNGSGEGADGIDSHDWENASNRSAEDVATQVRELDRAMRQGEILAKKVGKSKGNNAGTFGDLLTPKVDWREVLRDFTQELCAGKDESSWRKPNRRYLADDVYMPSLSSTTMTELVIGFDTSGSCFGSAEMTLFVSEITSIIERLAPAKTHVIYWDTAVQGVQVFEGGQFAVQDLKPAGGGGTDGSVLFTYLRKHNIRPDAIVQFTDGCISDWGTSDCPTLWAISGTAKAPFGVTIQLEV
jgi:predicted metal-dependent peptidase